MGFKKSHIISLLILLIVLPSFLFFNPDYTINIRYTKNYKGDSWENARTGFLWALSYLGAELPKGSFNQNIKWKNSSVFTLNYSQIGFNNHALNVLEEITDSIKKTEQYQLHKYIDLSQLITLLIGSSNHYYAITGVPKTYQDFLKNKKST